MKIIHVQDFSDPNLDIYARCSENELRHYYEPHGGVFIAESPKVVERAMNAGCIPISVLVEDRHIEGEAKEVLERAGDIPVYTASFDILKQLTGFPMARGVLCAMRRPELRSVEELCENAHRIAVLEEVVNPTNVGAIFRNAAAIGFDAVLLTKGCSDPLYRRAARVSMGTVFQIPWGYFSTDDKGFQRLHELGFKTAAMALRDDTLSIDDPLLQHEDKIAVVLGTEGDGLRDSTISGCDYTVKIPMAPGVDSLNVAAASAVAFWVLRHK